MPIAEILARLTAIVAIGGEPFGEPHCIYVDMAQCQFCTFLTPCSVDVGNVVYGIGIAVEFGNLGLCEGVCLGVEPYRNVAHRL